MALVEEGGLQVVVRVAAVAEVVELGAQGVLNTVAAARLRGVGGGAVLVRAAAGGDRGVAGVRIGERECPVGAVDVAARVVGVLAADVVEPGALARVGSLLERAVLVAWESFLLRAAVGVGRVVVAVRGPEGRVAVDGVGSVESWCWSVPSSGFCVESVESVASVS